MTARPDDDALSWGDEDDPTLHVGTPSDEESDEESDAGEPEEPAPATPVLPEGFTAVGRGAETVNTGEAGDAASSGAAQDTSHRDHDETPAIGNGALIALGVLGGVYLLATIGWIVGGLRLEGTAKYLVAPVGYQVSLWLAVAAPALWFLTTLWLTAGSRAWVRFAWLIGGAALLLPWPFIMLGAVGR
ncbi:DNA polymerase III subunit gamma/tau [Microbacterium candidum]|uniref:DNA polymerase III subunit gamma/tau n=1 Tax=Microbacterium candidum TaxID=3041922 RepID=A0ABT7N091_9MICO|nr:DNA polymerase III subunit gamma/tau [Microbacterium sp. ASV49]MDL9980119.1 DNA polymerase III subunit gamma/tau [Microbacterium sp. ASV49]